MKDFSTMLTEEEKDAIAVLVRGGFLAFGSAKLKDVRELDGRRRRTFRNRGRYDLVLALKDLNRPELDQPVLTDSDPDCVANTEPAAEIPLMDIDEMKIQDLEDEAIRLDYPAFKRGLNKPELKTFVEDARKRRELLNLKF